MVGMQEATKKDILFEHIFESQGFKNLRLALDKLLKEAIWWSFEKKVSSSFVRPIPMTQRAPDTQDYLSISEYKKVILEAVRRSEQAKGLITFHHQFNNTYGLTIPVILETKMLGFFGICGIKSKIPQGILELISGYVKTLVEKMLKESELARVYEVVRPRTIALSTVHTIHRLISSTLDIKELFPRIARLSLQVLRAERVRISMVDKHTKELINVASIDYRKSKNIFKITKCSVLEKKVAQCGVTIRKRGFLCVPLVDEEICGIIAIRDKVGERGFTIFDQEILTTLAEQAVIAIRNAQLYKEQEDLTISTIKSLSHLLDSKFPHIYTHTDFFVELLLEIGKEMGLSKSELKLLHYSAILPDLGKLVMPEEILKKPKALSDKERKIVKAHTVKGIEILKYLDVLKPVIPIILHHHEKFDGRGYPGRLKGKRIPLGSRIMALGDAFEAMVCHRPYRNPLPFRMAVSEIRRQAGNQFDPDVVKAFMRLANDGRIEALLRKHHDRLRTIF